jgi:hypothetical protein
MGERALLATTAAMLAQAVLAEVLRLSGPSAEADAAARQALALYERKEDRVSAARARPLLAAGTSMTGPLQVNGGA